MKQVLKKANVLVVFFLAMAYLGCEDVNNMFPDVLSAFTYTVNEDTGKYQQTKKNSHSILLHMRS